ncbi:MAG: sugar phosphate nucleotidyltransferase [Verrucomicrobiota bacterium]
MTPSKAVITSANPADKHLPLQSLVDSSGEPRTALQILLSDIFGSGIQSVAIVIPPGEETRFRGAAGEFVDRLTFLEQADPMGYGHAVSLASDFVGGEPFLLLVGDHLFRSTGDSSCVAQMLEAASSANATVSGVQPTHESQLHLYGTVAATLRAGSSTLYEVAKIMEKPSPTLAEQELIVPGLRSGHYLCFFGLHVLPPRAMDYLKEQRAQQALGSRLLLTPTLNHLAESGEYLALRMEGQRFNLGERYGLLRAQMALSLAGPHRDEVMTMIIELLANDRSS